MPPTTADLGVALGVVEALQHAIRFNPPGDYYAFFWDARNPRSPLGPRGYHFYVDPEQIQRASLLLLGAQPDLLAGSSLSELRDTLLDFFRFHLALFDDGALMFAFRQFQDLSEFVHLDGLRIAAALCDYIAEIRQPKIYLLPAQRLSVAADYAGSRLFLLRPQASLDSLLPALATEHPHLDGRRFPPFSPQRAEGSLGDKDSWLGCVAPSDQQAFALIEGLLGAISLVLPLPLSRVFSIAPRIPYIYSIGNRWLARGSGPTFPPLIEDSRLEQQDLALLPRLFEAARPADDQRRLETALQFAGAGWARHGRLSFLHNAIAFDALFGKKSGVGASIKAGVTQHAGAIPSILDRITRLLDIRNALLHGEIASIEASPQYANYYGLFGRSPQEDQVSILATCVRSLA